MNLTDLLKIFDLKPRFFFALFAIGVIFLFLPVSISDVFGITQLVGTYRSWIGITTIIFFVFWLIQLQPWELIFKFFQTRKFKKNFEIILANLSQEERILLAFCLAKKKQTIHLYFAHAVATSLRAKGLLDYVGGLVHTRATPFTIPSWVWNELLKNKFDLIPESDWDDQRLLSAFKIIENQIWDIEKKTF